MRLFLYKYHTNIIRIIDISLGWSIISKGLVQNNYYNAFLGESLNFINITSASKGDSHEVSSTFFSKLLALFFKDQGPNESFKNISKLIVLLLNTPGIEIPSKFFNGSIENIVKEIYYEFKNLLKREPEDKINKYFKTLEKVPPLISDCPELTNKQKLDYCNCERAFMKLYLRDLLFKLKKYEWVKE